MKKYSIVVLVIILLLIFFKTSYTDNTRELIPVKKMDWQYLIETESSSWIDRIEIESNSTSIAVPNQKDFATLMIDNEDEISNKGKSNYVKIKVRFEEIPWFSSQHYPGKYNGKECIFFISWDLANQVKKLIPFG